MNTINSIASPDAIPAPAESREPTEIGETIARVRRHGGLMQGVDDPRNVPHPFGGYCKVCARKSPPVLTLLDPAWRKLDEKLAPGWFPVTCCEACYAESTRDTDRDRRNREWWSKRCPPEYQEPWNSGKGSQRLLDRVMAWHPKDGRGLVIHGDSGTGKTRAVWRRLQLLADEGWGFEFFQSLDLCEGIPPEAFTTQLLVLDDLGNDLYGQKFEVRLLKLLSDRVAWRRPIIVTTQSNGGALAERFSDSGTAKAVIRRLREHCDHVAAVGVETSM